MAYGQDGHIGISFQESFGDGEYNVDSMDFFPIVSESVTEKIEELISESLNSRYDEPDAYPGMHTIEGDIVMEAHPHLVGKLLKACFGQSSEHAMVASCYNHVFVPLPEDWDAERYALPPITIEAYRDTGSAYLYYDCCVNQLAFELAQGALYKVTASIIGGRFAWAEKQTPSYIPGSMWSWDTASISLGGNAIDHASNLTITINNNLATKSYLDGTRAPNRILRDGFRTVEIAGTMLLVGDTEARYYRDRTMQRLMLSVTDPATVMNAHNQLTIDVPQMQYTEFPANIGGSGLIEVGFSAKGKFDSSSNYSVQATLVNTTEAY